MSEAAQSSVKSNPLLIPKALLKTMRPRQWPKNAAVFAALLFDGKLFHPTLFLHVLAAFVCFCLISSTTYLINDLVDIEKDRLHPTKRFRPLAAGILPPWVAVSAAVGFVVVCLPLAFWLDGWFSLILLGYLAVTLAYTFYLKHIVIVELLVLASGFVLRVAGGVAVSNVERFSPWLYVCTTLLALFLVMGKRRHELALLQHDASAHRASLGAYTLDFLDEMIRLVISVTVMAYSLYTFSAPNLPANHTMMLTIPFVLYGLFRYLYLIHVKGEGGAPEDLMLKDRPLLFDIVLWVLSVVVVLYVLK